MWRSLAIVHERRSATGGTYDITEDELHSDAMGGLMARHVAAKGFCTIAPGFVSADVVSKAKVDAEYLPFYDVNPLIADGLLGPEGSTRIADLSSGSENEASVAGEHLAAVDASLTQLWSMICPHADVLGLEMVLRANGVVHQAGDALTEEEALPLMEKDVSKWQAQFLRHTLMVLVFLGPKAGVLELQPWGQGDADPVQLRTLPGMAVVLRADTMLHTFSSAGESLAVSCFVLSSNDRKGMPITAGLSMPPVSRRLEDWSMDRLMELKKREETGNVGWDPAIPRHWQYVMNHTFHKGQITGIASSSVYYPRAQDTERWFAGTHCGPDFATEVPAVRWNHHEVYEAEGNNHQKTNCFHGSFMDGTELFDHKFFSLSLFESQGFDPQARLLLESAYLCLNGMGFEKKTLMNAAGGIYVGVSSSEWAFAGSLMPSGGVSGVASLLSGRISFCLGMKGPSITLSTEGASSLTCALLGAESVQLKGTAVGNDFACALGVQVLLSPVWWVQQSLQGFLSKSGRCRTFDASADGYIRGDGCGSVGMKNTSSLVDGSVVKNDTDFLGAVAGGMHSHSGQSASMHAPNAAAEQQVVADAIRNARVSHEDVDGVEAHGVGRFLDDAVEVNALWRAHRCETNPERFSLSAVKTSQGNQVEAAGMASLLKIVYAARSGHQTPMVHLRQSNPHLDPFEQPLDMLGECLEFPFQSTFNGAKARGIGGSLAYLLAWGACPEPASEPQEEEEQPRAPIFNSRPLPTFWPGGGGELDADQQPTLRDGYFISGSWNTDQEPQKMHVESQGVYTSTITLGENRWEKFQILLDGDESRALHPPRHMAGKGDELLGPSPSAEAPSWMIDGRSWPEPRQNPDMGMPGELYEIKLHVAGKWRMVTWDKAKLQAIGSGAPLEIPRVRYYVASSWTEWEMEEMDADESEPGLFRLDVKVPPRITGNFQIVRNRDWDQTFFPEDGSDDTRPDQAVFGPDISGDATWRLTPRGTGGLFRIEFQRTVDASGDDVRRVSWRQMEA